MQFRIATRTLQELKNRYENSWRGHRYSTLTKPEWESPVSDNGCTLQVPKSSRCMVTIENGDIWQPMTCRSFHDSRVQWSMISGHHISGIRVAMPFATLTFFESWKVSQKIISSPGVKNFTLLFSKSRVMWILHQNIRVLSAPWW